MGFLLLGIDSVIAGIAVSPIVDRGMRLRLAALFGVADIVGFLVGVGLGWQISGGASAAVETTILLALGAWLLVVAAGTRRFTANWTVWALPWALTVDNLAYGLVGDHSTSSLFGQAAQQGSSSALMAFAGLFVGAVLPRLVPALERRTVAMRLAGASLFVAAGALLLVG
jgi:putative Mn2+ efflux pump MntP